MSQTMNDVSLIIKTFERQEALERLLGSIRTHGYADCPVLVADDSKEPYRDAVLEHFGDLVDEYVVLPFDSGLSKGRNELLKRVETTYFVLNDDDFVYDERTDLEWMREQLETSDVELLSAILYCSPLSTLEEKGPLYSLDAIRYLLQHPVDCARSLLNEGAEGCTEVARFHGLIEAQDRNVVLHDLPDYTPPLTRCDFGFNFFMADTEAVRKKVGGWNDALKVAEHWEFFYRAKQGGLRVATTEEVGVVHPPPPNNEEYSTHRNGRFQHFRQRGLSAHDFDRLVLPQGG